MNQEDKKTLPQRVAERVKARGIRLRKRSKGGQEIWELGPEEQRFRVLAVEPERAAQAPVGADQAETIRVAEFVPPGIAKHWMAQGLAFADACGNAHIEAPGIVIQVLGNRPEEKAERAPLDEGIREWRGAALRVVFHLLVQPTIIEASIRDLASRLGVSKGTVVGVLADLELTGHVARTPAGKRRMHADPKLEERWRFEYVRRLRPKLLLGRFASAKMDWYRAFDPAKFGAVWGGESAAEALGLDLRAGIRTLYARNPLTEIARALRLKADPEGTIEIRETFWDSDMTWRPPGVTPDLLTVADLEATRDPRCIDAAEELLARHRGPQ